MEKEIIKNIPHGIYQKLGWLIVILGLLFVVMIFKQIKETRFIGRGTTETNQFTVTGRGEAFINPDVAKITFTVEKESKTIKEAITDIDMRVKKIVAFLKEQKIDEKDIKTVQNTVYPQYDYNVCTGSFPCTQTQKLRGYSASRSIEVKVRDMDNAPIVLEGISGLEVTNLQGPEFTVSDEDKVQLEARTDAIKNAREKAEELAKALGVKIVRVVNFSENTGGQNYPQPMMYAKSADMVQEAGNGGAMIPAGQNKYTSEVSIVYEIR